MKCKYCNSMNPEGMPVCLYCARPIVSLEKEETVNKEPIQSVKELVPERKEEVGSATTLPPTKIRPQVSGQPVMPDPISEPAHAERSEPELKRQEEILSVKVDVKPVNETVKSRKEIKKEEKIRKKAEKERMRQQKKGITEESLDGHVETEGGYAINNDRYYDNVEPEKMGEATVSPKTVAAKALSFLGALIAVALLLIYYFG